MTTEFKVGVLVLVGIALLFYMSFRVGKFGSLSEGQGYPVTVHFKNVAGLDVKSPVQVAGVQVGTVRRSRSIRTGQRRRSSSRTTFIYRSTARLR